MIPETFVNPLRIPKLVREIKRSVAAGEDAVAERAEDDPASEMEQSAEYTPPKVRVKSMVATRRVAQQFGVLLAAAAFARGFFGANRKAFVGDGAETNWTIHRQWFSDFVAILDFIHALTYVFSSAMAGRAFRQGWETYERWINWVWQGKVGEMIAELEQRQKELGVPEAKESETSPRQVVAAASVYLKNNQERMKYDEYRRWTRRELPAVFTPKKMTIKEGEVPDPLEVRASPFVAVEGQWLDSKGQPKSGWSSSVFGRIDGSFWYAQTRPDAQGKFSLKVPHGLGEDELKAAVEYTQPGPDSNKKVHVVGGGRTEAIQDKQYDGRYRTSQLLPDREVEVTVSADGFKTASRKLSLPEGKTEEVTFVLEPK